jgi:hypothetical protein
MHGSLSPGVIVAGGCSICKSYNKDFSGWPFFPAAKAGPDSMNA